MEPTRYRAVGLLMVLTTLLLGPQAIGASAHHQQKWVEGSISSIDVQGRHLAVSEKGKETPVEVSWDGQTKGFESLHAKAESFQNETVGHVKTGAHVRIRCAVHAGKMLARHVVLQPSDEKPAATAAK